MPFVAKGKLGSTSGELFTLPFITLLSCIFLILLTEDYSYNVFAYMVIIYLLYAALQSKSSVEKSLANVGFKRDNFPYCAGLGLIASVVCIIIGNLIYSEFDSTASVFVPSFTFMASSVTPSVLVGLNVVSQYLVVGISEELGFTYFASSLFNKFVNGSIIAYILSRLLWAANHYPNWSESNTPAIMYVILFIWGLVFVSLYVLTGNILTSVVAHAHMNALVILSQSTNILYLMVFTVVLGIILMTNPDKLKRKIR
jgi:membrane protease YdiL (CAAX protease family)